MHLFIFFILIRWRSESLISSTVRISRIPSSVSKGGNIAQTWPIRVVISHGLSHGSKVGMETKLGSAKTSDHQSTPHDALTRLGERHPLSAGADRRHLAPLGGTPTWKTKAARSRVQNLRDSGSDRRFLTRILTCWLHALMFSVIGISALFIIFFYDVNQFEFVYCNFFEELRVWLDVSATAFLQTRSSGI